MCSEQKAKLHCDSGICRSESYYNDSRQVILEVL